MAKHPIIFGFLLLFLVVATARHAESYNYMVLSSEWYGSVCKNNKCKELNFTEINRFNIHGLWPSNETEPQKPAQCNNSDILKYKHFPAKMKEELHLKWNGLSCPTKVFLSYEWNKHGTCWNPELHKIPKLELLEQMYSNGLEEQGDLDGGSSLLERLFLNKHLIRPSRKQQQQHKEIHEDIHRQLGYFWTALQIADRYNLYKFLASKDIVPAPKNVTYPLTDVRNAITQSLNISNIVIRCGLGEGEFSENSKVKYLLDIRVCLDMDYNARDCPDKLMLQNDCGKDEKVQILYLSIPEILETRLNPEAAMQ